MDITIRQMEQQEADYVRKLGQRAFAGIESLWVSKPKMALVAIKEEKIVGAILYKFIQTKTKKIGYIDYAFVDPEYHSQGIGNVLYKETVEHLWQQGCDALAAVVKDDNVGSWGLFLKNGFTRVSLPELIRQFGLFGMLQQYFGTPFCIGIGMEYYVALRDKTCPSGKGGNGKQITSYFLTNLLLILIILFRNPKHIHLFLAAYTIILMGGLLAGYLGTLLSKRKWHFRLNNGGALISALINFGGLYPMIGNWYPDRYENTHEFRRDMGVNALFGWIFVLCISILPVIDVVQHPILPYLSQISSFFLIYRILSFYPFESFGGRRVFTWNKWLYGAMSVLSAVVIALQYI